MFISNRKEITEAEVRRAAQRAVKKMLKEIENEPRFIIEVRPDNAVADPKQVEDILGWLFRRKEVNNGK